MTQKKFKILVIVLLCIVLTFYGYFKAKYFFEIDACLDKGGSWNHEKKECVLDNNQTQFDFTVLNDNRFAGGFEYETLKKIKPKTLHFENYTFVIGFDSSQNSSLVLYYGNKEIYSPKHYDGVYDTVMLANLNNDGIPDFLVSYQFEDGATLYGYISRSTAIFKEIIVFDEWQETYCFVGGDTLKYILPYKSRTLTMTAETI